MSKYPDTFTKAETFHALACFNRGRRDAGHGPVETLETKLRNVACTALEILFRHAAEDYGPDPDSVLEDVAELLSSLGAYGVEGITAPESFLDGLEYVNFGDPYDTTIWYDRCAGTFGIGSWGDWLEAAEQEHAEETDSTLCGMCGEWHDDDTFDGDAYSCPYHVAKLKES